MQVRSQFDGFNEWIHQTILKNSDSNDKILNYVVGFNQSLGELVDYTQSVEEEQKEIIKKIDEQPEIKQGHEEQSDITQ